MSAIQLLHRVTVDLKPQVFITYFQSWRENKMRRPKAFNSPEKHFVSFCFFVVVVGCSFKIRKGPCINLSASERRPFLTFRRRDPKCQRAKRLSLISGLKLHASAQPAAPPQSEKSPTRRKVTCSPPAAAAFFHHFPSCTLFFFLITKGILKKKKTRQKKCRWAHA